jgi:hypothetical protein
MQNTYVEDFNKAVIKNYLGKFEYNFYYNIVHFKKVVLPG